MDKSQVAAILDEMGTLLELQGENPFRCNAYHNAARALEQTEGNLADLVASGNLREVKGIGDTMQEKITALVTTGRLEAYETLKTKIPTGMLEMLRVPGMGPKKVKALYDTLGVSDLEQLRVACQEDKVAHLKGFGAKTQKNILDGLAFLDKTGKRHLLYEALEVAEPLFERIRAHPKVIRAELCGSLRRRRETIADIDLLVSTRDPAAVMDLFANDGSVASLVGRGETKCSITLHNGMNADLRVVTD